MIRRSVRRLTQLLVYGFVGVGGYSVVNKSPHEQFKKPEIKQVISREPYSVQLLFHLPLNSISRVWGKMSHVELPLFCRAFVYTAYIKTYKCDVSEAENEDLKSYICFGDFFARTLKKETRPISQDRHLVSPSDGVILSMGRVHACQVNHVKNKDYTLEYFIGPKTWKISKRDLLNDSEYNGSLMSSFYGLFSGLFSSGVSEKIPVSNQKDMVSLSSPSSPPPSSSPSFQAPCDSYPSSLKTHQSNHLYHCTIYLAPGDYHRFHSPVDWNCTFRRHFPGYLLSVSPSMAQRIPELMNVNERVVYVGGWRHGFMSMTLVGATNVGSIKVYNDPLLVTNIKENQPTMIDTHFSHHNSMSVSPSSPPPPLPQITPPSLPPPLDNSTPSHQKTGEQSLNPPPPQPSFLRKMTFKKGDAFGQFNLGSTIVLVFEAPPNFQFSHQIGGKLKYGQALGAILQ